MVGARGGSQPTHGITEAEIAGGEWTGDLVQLSKAYPHHFPFLSSHPLREVFTTP